MVISDLVHIHSSTAFAVVQRHQRVKATVLPAIKDGGGEGL